ncbi:hypothetical protein V6Z12_A13G045600 [Gossypium hirsutum]
MCKMDLACMGDLAWTDNPAVRMRFAGVCSLKWKCAHMNMN